ncbi:hypothetical protein PBI_JUDY_48 [Arthrobacter phage Judy]|uniref:Uncharacterized protein n=1 Tax=Arthrobacter phage Judy TaxID=2419958 RepID=A0A3G2KGM6_9CAUD|nr:hypothetical protein HOU50_gp48 [Arthrobacter phage Judy]AYN58118.1 hypothetical protein PBI_JUDY_48 [Arthrobacter phage Judy]
MIGLYNARPAQVQAMRIILGATTRGQIRGFCPNANVGVKLERVDSELREDETDIRWVLVDNGKGRVSEMRHDGDWLVRESDESFVIMPDQEFSERYVRA